MRQRGTPTGPSIAARWVVLPCAVGAGRGPELECVELDVLQMEAEPDGAPGKRTDVGAPLPARDLGDAGRHERIGLGEHEARDRCARVVEQLEAYRGDLVGAVPLATCLHVHRQAASLEAQGAGGEGPLVGPGLHRHEAVERQRRQPDRVAGRVAELEQVEGIAPARASVVEPEPVAVGHWASHIGVAVVEASPGAERQEVVAAGGASEAEPVAAVD